MEKVRERLEAAYELEKEQSSIYKRCSRIYHEILKFVDIKLYEHLLANEIEPEMQLMRWLRCVLSREFEPDTTMHLWDYILGGLYLQHTQYH